MEKTPYNMHMPAARLKPVVFLLFSTILLFAFLFTIRFAFAQTAKSNCVVTAVGDAPTPTLPPDCIDTSSTSPGGGSGGPNPTAPPAPSELRQAIIDEFGIYMNGYDDAHLQWAWEEFWEISHTRFNERVRGSVIEAIPVSPNYYSEQVGCPDGGSTDVKLKAYTDKSFFKFLLIHELGHVVRNCNDRNVIQWNEHLNAYAIEGGISYYGNNASTCTGSDNHSEDYADMITYYVNPWAGLATPACAPDKNPPNPFSPLQDSAKEHYTVVKRVLDK